MDVMTRLDAAIKKAWEEDIRSDDMDDHPFREDAFKVDLYYHSRERFGPFYSKGTGGFSMLDGMRFSYSLPLSCSFHSARASSLKPASVRKR